MAGLSRLGEPPEVFEKGSDVCQTVNHEKSSVWDGQGSGEKSPQETRSVVLRPGSG